MISDLKKAGFTGDKIVLAAHSLGGVMSQKYAAENPNLVKAQVLMGSVLQRSLREILPDGTSHFKYEVPTLTLGGTKDGLMRITRVTESFWHSFENITPSQKDLFPVVALEGVNHMGFMSGSPPGLVRKRDLVADVSEA